MKKIAILVIVLFVIQSCSDSNKKFDASGVFESNEIIVSSEANGLITSLQINEGSVVKAGEIVGTIDSTQLYLKKKQLEAQIFALLGKRPDIQTQLASFEEQIKAAKKEQKRVQNLLKSDAATQKQLDDITAQIEVLQKQQDAQRSNLAITVEGISNESVPMQIQVEQLIDQLKKCKINNPINGTVLSKYAKENEMTVYGKPLYKIADISNLILRVYITGEQLPQIQLHKKVKVFSDSGEDSYTETTGEIIWISDKAEFTPKTIQTKDERANLVYAVKIQVKNSGNLKIGMYGEILFN